MTEPWAESWEVDDTEPWWIVEGKLGPLYRLYIKDMNEALPERTAAASRHYGGRPFPCGMIYALGVVEMLEGEWLNPSR